MAADGNDDPGVLGNLPRARPGRRSAKRGTGATDATSPSAGGRTAPAAQRAKRSAASGTTARPARRSGAGSSARSRRSVSTPPPRPAQPAQSSGGGDPITQAVRLAGKVAETGVKTATALLKRLPGR